MTVKINLPAVGTVLRKIIEHKTEEVAGCKDEISLTQIKHGLEGRGALAVPDFTAALRRSGRNAGEATVSASGPVNVIAEIKKASPSMGAISSPFMDKLGVAGMAAAYETAGAAAVSVLTDGRFFGGSGVDLQAVSGRVSIPVLRKEFIIDEYQIYEARLLGASAVLLIASLFDARDLAYMLRLTRALGMEALVETVTAEEVDRAVESGAAVIGINNRDLKTMTIDLNRTVELASLIPPEQVVVAESGINSKDDVAMLLKAADIDAILAGTSIVTAPDPVKAIQELRCE